MRRLLPHPFMSISLLILWLTLKNSISYGEILLGGLLAFVIPWVTFPFWPQAPRVRRPFALLAYGFIVIWDVVIASVQVARVILFLPQAQIKSAFITIPLDISCPEAITLLAGTITLTPGTLTADIAADGRSLLVHALHAPQPDAVRNEIKMRYEARLKRIFE